MFLDAFADDPVQFLVAPFENKRVKYLFLDMRMNVQFGPDLFKDRSIITFLIRLGLTEKAVHLAMVLFQKFECIGRAAGKHRADGLDRPGYQTVIALLCPAGPRTGSCRLLRRGTI